MKKPGGIFVVLLIVMAVLGGGQTSVWKKIDRGLDYAEIPTGQISMAGDSRITIIRINPEFFALKLLTASQLKVDNLPAPQWVKKYNLICAVNAGMFKTDYKTNVGYMQNYSHVNNARYNKKYLSIAAFNPKNKKSPYFRIFDSDETKMEHIVASYHTVIQNLRLIKHPGRNRWSKQNKKWSEVALGQDRKGNILFIFSRSPYSMYEFNRHLLGHPIGLVCAQHLEGGPEASLYFNHRGVEIKKMGSYETGFSENNDNHAYWPIPNVIGVVKRK